MRAHAHKCSELRLTFKMSAGALYKALEETENSLNVTNAFDGARNARFSAQSHAHCLLTQHLLLPALNNII